ncbi:MAG: hypothetical protein IJS45_11460 [Clostridia bacterium]|nr:hypothetical protein [Clostridia bacterium]
MESINTEKQTKKYRFYPRKLARSVAKANMRRAGMRKINRRFQKYWKEFVIVKDNRRRSTKRA